MIYCNRISISQAVSNLKKIDRTENGVDLKKSEEMK